MSQYEKMLQEMRDAQWDAAQAKKRQMLEPDNEKSIETEAENRKAERQGQRGPADECHWHYDYYEVCA